MNFRCFPPPPKSSEHSAENFLKCGYSAVQAIANEIPVDTVFDSTMGTHTNNAPSLLEFIAFRIRCETIARPDLLQSKQSEKLQ